MNVLFLHGLESGPHGSKYHALVAADFNVTAPDFRGKNLKERVEATVGLLSPNVVVVGSSYGGITAVLAAMQVAPKAMVLCAPALERSEAPNHNPASLVAACPTIIIHGINDDVIPMEVSKKFAARHPAIQLIEVNDGHRLAADSSVAEIINAVGKLV